MKVPVKLLTDGVNKNCVLVARKFIYALGPQRDSEANEQNRFDEHDGKFQMRRDSTLHPFVVSGTMATVVKANENKNKVTRPTHEQRPHEPVTKLDDVIDLVTVLGRVHRLPEELIDECEATHIFRDPLLQVARAAPAACARVARDEN